MTLAKLRAHVRAIGGRGKGRYAWAGMRKRPPFWCTARICCTVYHTTKRKPTFRTDYLSAYASHAQAMTALTRYGIRNGTRPAPGGTSTTTIYFFYALVLVEKEFQMNTRCKDV